MGVPKIVVTCSAADGCFSMAQDIKSVTVDGVEIPRDALRSVNLTAEGGTMRLCLALAGNILFETVEDEPKFAEALG